MIRIIFNIAIIIISLYLTDSFLQKKRLHLEKLEKILQQKQTNLEQLKSQLEKVSKFNYEIKKNKVLGFLYFLNNHLNDYLTLKSVSFYKNSLNLVILSSSEIFFKKFTKVLNRYFSKVKLELLKKYRTYNLRLYKITLS